MDPIEARLNPIDLGDLTQAPDLIMFMPAGTHEIHASKQGRPFTTTVRVEPRTATTLQTVLGQLIEAKRPQRPFFDFDHLAGAASARPQEFVWCDVPRPGVYVRPEWTKSGAEAVAGKDYRAFSPRFFTDEATPANVTGIPFVCGGLVNDPAFNQILPLSAKEAGARPASTPPPQKSMTPEELAALQAANKQLEQDKAAVQAKADQSAEELKAKQAELTAIQKRAEELESTVQAQRKRDEEAAIAAAVARGAIGQKDDALQAKWRKSIQADPASIELLNGIPGREHLTERVTQSNVKITGEAIEAAFKGYLEEAKPLEKGRIYLREFEPILAKGGRIPFERFPIEASTNSLGTLATAIVAQRTLSLIFSKRPMLLAFCNDFSSDGALYGQTVTTRSIALPTVQTFGGTISNATTGDVSVILNQMKEVAFTWLVTEYGATNRNLVEEHAQALAVALGNSIVDYVAALITGSFTATTVILEAVTDYSTVSALVKAMNIAGTPDFNRNAIVNSAVAESFRNDELMLANFDKNTTNAYAIWRNVMGFDAIYEYPALPENSIHLHSFFFQKDALLLVSRVPITPNSVSGAGYPGRISTVTDPVTGLSIIANDWIAADTWAVNNRLVCLYGAARGVVASGQTLCHQ
jgi:hypothetical protein